MRRGCQVANANLPWLLFQFLSHWMYPDLLGPNPQLRTHPPSRASATYNGWIPGFNLPTPFHGDHTSFHAYYWEGSGVKCWGENFCFALLQKNLVSNHYKAFRLLSAYSFICFFLAASLCLIGSYGISPTATILSGSFLRSSLPNMSMSGLSFVAG